MKRKDIIAVFDNDRSLVAAIKRLMDNKIPVADAHTPFPVHDVLKLLGRESRLPYFSVFAGICTVILVFAFLYYTAVIDYPLIYGGKPPFSFPSFVVIIYLLTILLTFIFTVLVFQVRSGLYPGKEAELAFSGSTDDKFVILLGGEDALSDEMKGMASSILEESGAVEIID
ncbi:MAG: DUF3341 domain-containing protein [Bacteroidales bacterium]